MRNLLILALLCLSTLSGCTVTAWLYRVQGPLSSQTPAPVYVAKVTGGFYSGTFSAILNEGEIFKGRWDTVRRPSSSKLRLP
jgi:hypothetical protein